MKAIFAILLLSLIFFSGCTIRTNDQASTDAMYEEYCNNTQHGIFYGDIQSFAKVMSGPEIFVDKQSNKQLPFILTARQNGDWNSLISYLYDGSSDLNSNYSIITGLQHSDKIFGKVDRIELIRHHTVSCGIDPIWSGNTSSVEYTRYTFRVFHQSKTTGEQIMLTNSPDGELKVINWLIIQ